MDPASHRRHQTDTRHRVKVRSRNEVRVGERGVRRIWLPAPRQIVHLSGATVAQNPSITRLDQLPPLTISLLLNVQIIVNSGTTPNVIFNALASTAGGFTNAAGSYQHSNANTGVGHVTAPLVNGGLSWQVTIGGTVNYDLTVNLVAVEAQ